MTILQAGMCKITYLYMLYSLNLSMQHHPKGLM